MFEDKVIAISYGDVFLNNRIRTRSGGRWKLKVQHSCIHFIHLNPIYFFELFDTRLYLNRFGSLVTEPLDKGFGILKLFLLILKCPHLLLPPLFAQHYIMRVIYLIVVYLTKRDLDCTESSGINKGPVVRNQYNRIGTGSQKVLEPLDGFN